MKQGIFVCILSLSLCVSSTVTESTQGKPVPEIAPKLDNNNTITTPTSAPIAPTIKTDTPTKTDNTTKPPVTPNDNKTTPDKTLTTVPSVPTPADNKTSTAKPTTTPVTPTTNATTVKPDDKTTSTTVAPVTSTTTKPAEASTTAKPLTRSFDGPSFMGGIILTLGMLAIGFMGFKYYKSQTERNYHTL